jgi:hypothetical protein
MQTESCFSTLPSTPLTRLIRTTSGASSGRRSEASLFWETTNTIYSKLSVDTKMINLMKPINGSKRTSSQDLIKNTLKLAGTQQVNLFGTIYKQNLYKLMVINSTSTSSKLSNTFMTTGLRRISMKLERHLQKCSQKELNT